MTVIDRHYYQNLTQNPDLQDRYARAVDTIAAMRGGPVSLVTGTDLYWDVRAIMFFDVRAEWNCTGTEAFVWGYDGSRVFAQNWQSFLVYLGTRAN